MMFVGDEGKILAGFLGTAPEIIPKRKMKAYQGKKALPKQERKMRSIQWAEAIKNNEESPGSFIHAEPVTEAINLAAIALRARKKVEYDSANMKITNDNEANKYLTREYREGWKI